jgi:beta-galactosidase
LTVHIDVAHRGVGTASCGPDIDPRHSIAAGTYRFAYRLRLLSASDN